jgi:hypothetical protein
MTFLAIVLGLVAQVLADGERFSCVRIYETKTQDAAHTILDTQFANNSEFPTMYVSIFQLFRCLKMLRDKKYDDAADRLVEYFNGRGESFPWFFNKASDQQSESTRRRNLEKQKKERESHGDEDEDEEDERPSKNKKTGDIKEEEKEETSWKKRNWDDDDEREWKKK